MLVVLCQQIAVYLVEHCAAVSLCILNRACRLYSPVLFPARPSHRYPELAAVWQLTLRLQGVV